MIKSVFKEICIILLLCLAIVLVLGVIFYDDIPSNKIVPNKLEPYVTPDDIKNEIEEQISETNKIEVTYEVNESDLKMYKREKSYATGKPDPFSAEAIENTVNGGDGNTNSNTTNNTNGNSTSSSNGQTSTSSYWSNGQFTK